MVKEGLDGNFNITMKVENFGMENNWGKAGLMIRAWLEASSKHFSIFLQKDGNTAGATILWRNTTNGVTVTYDSDLQDRKRVSSIPQNQCWRSVGPSW
jgi:hypothetical protein